ncbi:MAG: hypothetical protein WD623_17090 [Marinobacter sp.]|uniref:hypothetical protein n=1 Tax=Marinobacter sp. TaxID=50741 RepID=UPI0034A02A47
MGNANEFHRPTVRPDAPKLPPQPELLMPAMPPLKLLAVLEFWLHIYFRRRHFKKLFEALTQETDHTLSDIGYCRTDINWALNLPLKIDALKALEACRKERGHRFTAESDNGPKSGALLAPNS